MANGSDRRTHTEEAGVKSLRRDRCSRDAPDPKALMDVLLLQTVFHKVGFFGVFFFFKSKVSPLQEKLSFIQRVMRKPEQTRVLAG